MHFESKIYTSRTSRFKIKTQQKKTHPATKYIQTNHLHQTNEIDLVVKKLSARVRHVPALMFVLQPPIFLRAAACRPRVSK